MLHSETETEADPMRERTLLYATDSRDSYLLFDQAVRRGGLSGEKHDAFVGDVALGQNRFLLLLGVGDRTWLEADDLDGNPAETPSPEIVGTILEVAVSANTAVPGVQTGLHRLITEV